MTKNQIYPILPTVHQVECVCTWGVPTRGTFLESPNVKDSSILGSTLGAPLISGTAISHLTYTASQTTCAIMSFLTNP